MLVSIMKAARELGVNASTLRRKIRDGEWPAYRLGPKATRVDLEELKRLARKQQNSTGRCAAIASRDDDA